MVLGILDSHMQNNETRQLSYTYTKINSKRIKDLKVGTFFAVRWLRLHASTSGDMGLIPGQATKIPHAMWHVQKN